MQISSASSAYVQRANIQPRRSAQEDPKKTFDAIGSALESGDIDTAKELFTKLQKNAPQPGGPSGSEDSNPLSEKIDALSAALESGDVEAANEAYADLEETLSKGPGGRGGPGGPPPAERDSSSFSFTSQELDILA